MPWTAPSRGARASRASRTSTFTTTSRSVPRTPVFGARRDCQRPGHLRPELATLPERRFDGGGRHHVGLSLGARLRRGALAHLRPRHRLTGALTYRAPFRRSAARNRQARDRWARLATPEP